MLNMTPEAVQDIVREYSDDIKKLEDCCNRFAQADEAIQIYRGPAAAAIRNNMKSKVPAFDELIRVTASYGTTSQAAANRAIEVENQLTSMIDG